MPLFLIAMPIESTAGHASLARSHTGSDMNASPSPLEIGNIRRAMLTLFVKKHERQGRRADVQRLVRRPFILRLTFVSIHGSQLAVAGIRPA